MAYRTTPLTSHSVAVSGTARESESTVGLLRRLSDELTTLFRQEVSLAGAEISHSLTTLLLGAASIAGAGAVLYAGFLMLLVAAVFGLAEVLPVWLAAACVGLTATLIGCVLLVIGRNKLIAPDLLPKRTAQSLRRDKDVLMRNGS